MSFLSTSRKLKRLGGQRNLAAVVFEESQLAVTVARGAGSGNVQVLQEVNAPLATGEGAPEPQQLWRQAAQELRSKFDPSEHRVIMGIRCEDVLFQTLQVPTAQKDELKQMLDLQIDNLTPLPAEEVVYDFEPMEVIDGQTRVLVAVARRDAVNAQVEALELAGLPPEVVKVDVLAVFRAMLQRNLLSADDKLNVLVALTPSAANVIIHSAGNVLAVRSILLETNALASTEGVAVLREELQRTLVATQSEHPQKNTGRLTFLTATEELRALAEEVARDWEIDREFLINGTAPAPALSLCLETTAGEKARLNLLPDEWRQQRRAARTRRRLIRLAVAAGVLYVLALGVFLTFMGLRRTQVRQVRQQVAKAQPEFAATKQLRDELLAMQNQLNTENSALEVLREVSSLMPENLKLSGFDYRKDLAVKLRGSAQSVNAANDFISKLERCPLFAGVKLPNPVRSDPGGLTRFDIICNLKTAGGGATPVHGTE